MSKNPNYLGILGSGERVFKQDYTHIEPDMLPLLQEAFLKINAGYNKAFICQEIDFERVVGNTICVEVTDANEIVYAQRVGKKGFTKFVKNKEAVPSSKAVLIMKKDDYRNFLLITAFIGAMAEPEIWDKNATAKSEEFWSNHALLYGSYEIIPGTETKKCPW